MNGQINLADLWRWRISRAFESIGRTGWIGLAAVILALILSIALLRGMAEKTRSLEKEISELRQGKIESTSNIASTSLLQIIPDASTAVEFPAQLHTTSAQHSIRIDRMEYQLQRETGKPLLLYRVDLVGIGSYPNLRNWLDNILKEHPTVGIDELILERPNSDVEEITTRLRLTLYMKAPT